MEIKQLFRQKRFPDSELKTLCLLLYLPVGLILLILRTLLAICVLLIGCSLSNSSIVHKLVNKIACLALGITVTVENPEKKDNADVYISNHLSIFDNLVVHTATGSVSPGKQMHPALSKGLGLHYFGNQSNPDTFKRNLVQFLAEQKTPLHFTPEEKITNGKALIKFKTYPFSISNKIQPICIWTKRPFFDLAITTLGASFWTDAFCYMFSPITHYKVKFLSSLEKKTLEDARFSDIVRQHIASELKVDVTDFSASDLVEWEKKQLFERQMPPPVARTMDGEVRRMATQVKEVLPHVPLSVIYKDLYKTRNVDNTITNILEGRLHFVPEQATTSQQPTSSSSSSISSSLSAPTNDRDAFNTAASIFSKSAHERNISFQERKEQLIANARKRYMEKHNILLL